MTKVLRLATIFVVLGLTACDQAPSPAVVDANFAASSVPHNGPDAKPMSGTVAVPPEQVAAFGKVIERYWQWIDEGVGMTETRGTGLRARWMVFGPWLWHEPRLG